MPNDVVPSGSCLDALASVERLAIARESVRGSPAHIVGANRKRLPTKAVGRRLTERTTLSVWLVAWERCLVAEVRILDNPLQGYGIAAGAGTQIGRV